MTIYSHHVFSWDKIRASDENIDWDNHVWFRQPVPQKDFITWLAC